MGKKHKHEEHENHERWLVSYADFITLLFATFTALYAISTADLAKFKQFSSSMKDSFSNQGMMTGIQSILNNKPSQNPDPVPISSNKGAGDGVMGKYKSLVMKEGDTEGKHQAMDDQAKAIRAAAIQRNQATLAQLQQIIQHLNQQVAQAQNQSRKILPVVPQPSSKKKTPPLTSRRNRFSAPPASILKVPEKARSIQLLNDKRGVRIRLDSKLLFPSGSAQLSAQAQKTLMQLAEGLKPLSLTHEIQVEGHTDNQPIHTVQFPTNWQLSTARAASVVTFWIAQDKLDPAHLAVMGYADSRPLADNQTEAGRAQNRRIDIIVVGTDLPLPEKSLNDESVKSSPSDLKEKATKALEQVQPKDETLSEKPSQLLRPGNLHEKPLSMPSTQHTAATPPDYVAPTFAKIDLGMKGPHPSK